MWVSKRRRSKPAAKTSDSLSLSSLPTEPVATSFASARLEARDQGILLYLDETESSLLIWLIQRIWILNITSIWMRL